MGYCLQEGGNMTGMQNRVMTGTGGCPFWASHDERLNLCS